jgi:YVTN family beta-propeller protein
MPARDGLRIARSAIAAAALCILVGSGAPAEAKGTGRIFISNEKSSTLTVLDNSDTVVATISVCARPRGMRFNREHTAIYIGCGDDDTIAVYDIATL